MQSGRGPVHLYVGVGDLLQVRQPLHEDVTLDQAPVRDIPADDLQVDLVIGHVQLKEMV
jgi:hypothetical protein